MKRLIVVAALACALAACGEAADESDDTAATETAAAPTEVVAMALDEMPMVGTYELTSTDGARTATTTVNADGTATTVEGDETMTGTWTSTGPDNYCVTYEGDAEPACYSETMSEDGTWNAVNVADPEDAWTIKRVS